MALNKVGLATLVGVGCFVAGLLIGKIEYSPKRAYNIWDFNHDGIMDLVVEANNGNKITLYGSEVILNEPYLAYEKEAYTKHPKKE